MRQSFTISFMTLVASLFMLPDCRGEVLEGRDRALVEALMAAQEAYVESVQNAEMQFTCSYGNSTRDGFYVFKTVSGKATWKGPNLRIDYNWRRQFGKEEPVRKRGVLLELENILVDYDPDRDRAFRSISQAKDFDREFFVRPSRSWFSYDLQFPYREIITSDETYDFGERNAEVIRKNSSVRLTLDNPKIDGNIVFEFDESIGGLLNKVTHTGVNGIRYRSEIEWESGGTRLRPSLIEKYRTFGSTERLVFRLSITSFKIPVISSELFAESSLGVSGNSRVTTYYPDKRVVVQDPEPKPDDLKATGERLRGTGFSAEIRNSEIE